MAIVKRPECTEELKREIERLQDAKRRALAIADERAKEAVALRLENERLRAQLAERQS
jgi:regulator of replication initiation timing